ncbi:diacylglycerol O-acyltransferase [Hahella sp. CCB-MM4]|uniref:WS/DGAT/MGAT family O-acyltransferase n=1 Tax=Hahella sp. (strain CCB-MM4) TaxID=1926491 RepID=UPI000B9AB839|nr:wax ester/triacylglycerol synthase family O-acyltransferase [Hahella sp. CCB-MM4]OZG72430.1 diacylglycerol O-acyltransferase [Hahella sp. CCB-MM4]
MKRVNILDAAWLAVESDDTPMHVGNLHIYSLPEGAPETFLRDLVQRMKDTNEVVPPWNLKLAYSGLLGRTIAPSWKIDKDIDLDYHVRHSALPKPGGERELGVLVSRLHSNHLDFKRPLWECHIIEGLENNRFAMYTKMHHSLIDGISGVRLTQKILSKDPNAKNMLAPWSIGPKRKPHGLAEDHVPTVQGAALQAIDSLRQQASTLPKLLSALGRLTYSASHNGSHLAAPFVGPQSVLNKRVTAQRRFATQQYQLDRLKNLAHQVDASLNDIVLYLCGSALRRFLLERDSLPNQALTAGIPVNIRPADDDGTGTAISFMIASLATDIDDPEERLEVIKDSTRTAKEHLQSLPRQALNQYTMLMMSPYILQLMTGLGGRMRPAFNITISNVPGPEEELYFEGAKLEAMYPVSLIAHGGALNITCLSYAGSLTFGYTGCRDTLPSMQRLAVYTGEALEELEQLFKPAKAKPKRAIRSRKTSKKAETA